MLILVQEIVALKQLIGKFGERKTVAGLAVEALLNAVLGHHVVDCNVFSYLACEVEEGEIFHPVVVVNQFSLVRFGAVEIEKLRNLLLDSLLIVVERVGIEQVSFLTLARRVAYHAGGSAYKQVGFVAALLQMTQHHDTAKVADVERVGRRVGAQIGRREVLLQIFFGTRQHLGKHATPF